MAHHVGEARYERDPDGQAMRGVRPLSRGTLATAIVIALILGVAGGGLLGYLGRGPVAGTVTPGPAYLYLTIGFDFATGLDRYLPANFSVPAHTLVLVTITNYDNASNPVSRDVATVAGTLGNLETMRASSDPQGMDMTAVPPSQVAHTFTLDTGGYAMNVPIPAANSLSDPMIVTFHAYFNTTGAFVWHCSAPCDSASMAALGFMRGTITVVDG